MTAVADISTPADAQAPTAARRDAPTNPRLNRARAFIRALGAKAARAELAPGMSPAERLFSRYIAVRRSTNGGLNAAQQRYLIEGVRDLEAHAAQESGAEAAAAARLAAEGRELFLVVNAGWVESEALYNAFKLAQYDPKTARNVLWGSYCEALTRALDSYTLAQDQTSPLSWARWEAQRVVSQDLLNEGQMLSLSDRDKRRAYGLRHAVASLEHGAEPVTPANVARIAKDYTEAEVEMLLPYLRDAARLDEAVADGEGSVTTVADRLADPGLTPEEEVIGSTAQLDLAEAVKAAVAALRKPVQRAVVEMLFGLNGRTTVEQFALYDGVYRNAAGEMFSAEAAVINTWGEDSYRIREAKQSELNAGFAAGELVFEPHSPQCAELYKLAGKPPTVGSVQQAFLSARQQLVTNPALAALAPLFA